MIAGLQQGEHWDWMITQPSIARHHASAVMSRLVMNSVWINRQGSNPINWWHYRELGDVRARKTVSRTLFSTPHISWKQVKYRPLAYFTLHSRLDTDKLIGILNHTDELWWKPTPWEKEKQNTKEIDVE